MSVSDFKKKKLVHVFNFYDTDKSGTIERKDFELALERTAKVRGWQSDGAKYKEFADGLFKVWEGLQGQADADNDGQVTLDEWIGMWEDFAKNSAEPAEWQSLYCKYVFQFQDEQGDGIIDREELLSVFGSFGVNKTDCDTAFQKMAKGKDSISWEDFQELWREFFTSEDPSAPGNFIFCIPVNLIG